MSVFLLVIYVVGLGSALVSGDIVGIVAWLVVGSLLLLSAGVLMGRQALLALRHIRKPLPALLLDGDGLECAYGRIRWRDVQSITEQHEEKETTKLVFALHPGTAWEPVATHYSTYLLAGRDEGSLRIEEWAKSKGITETLSRYYPGQEAPSVWSSSLSQT